LRYLLGRRHCRRLPRHNDIDIVANQTSRKLLQAISVAFCRAIFKLDILSFDIAEVA
jgi:hypothetical protein